MTVAQGKNKTNKQGKKKEKTQTCNCNQGAKELDESQHERNPKISRKRE